MPNYATLPRLDLTDAEVLFSPPEAGEGNWVGAPSVHRHDGRVYLGVRWRDPDRRGYALTVHERRGRTGGFEKRAELTAEDLGVVSVERPSLVTDPASGELTLYLSVEHGENDWTVQRLDAHAGVDPSTSRDVLRPDPGTTDRETVKDPYVLVVGRRLYMFYSGHDGRSEQAHLATSIDGETWTRSRANPVLGRGHWHDHHTRISCVLPAADAPVWHVFYEGSATDDYGATWNLRTGTGLSHDLRSVVDTSPDGPWLSAPAARHRNDAGDRFATCRYLDVLDHGDEWEVFVEVAREDGTFDLRRATVPLA